MHAWQVVEGFGALRVPWRQFRVEGSMAPVGQWQALQRPYGATLRGGLVRRRWWRRGARHAVAASRRRRLSEVAASTTPEQLAALGRGADGFPVRLVDVAPGVDVGHFLRAWEGECAVEAPRGGGEALVRFSSEAARAAALDHLGGGIRGLFRVDRSNASAGFASKP
jgi:hypothetical protein